MNWPTLYTVLVCALFLGLIIWVVKPSNKTKLEDYGNIPFDDDQKKKPSPTLEKQGS